MGPLRAFGEIGNFSADPPNTVINTSWGHHQVWRTGYFRGHLHDQLEEIHPAFPRRIDRGEFKLRRVVAVVVMTQTSACEGEGGVTIERAKAGDSRDGDAGTHLADPFLKV